MPITQLLGRLAQREKFAELGFSPAEQRQQPASPREQFLRGSFAEGRTGRARLGVFDLARVNIYSRDVVSGGP